MFSGLVFALFLSRALLSDAILQLDRTSDSITKGKTLTGPTCTFTNPDEFKQWTDNNGRAIPLGSSNNNHYEVRSTGAGRYQLNFNDINDAMGGSYKCESKRSTTPPVTYKLTVSATISQCDSNQGITYGDTVLIKCAPGGNPKPTITWTKKAANENFVKIRDGRFTSTLAGLNIHKVKDQDAGVYKIHYQQGNGQDSMEIKVSVGHRPKINKTITKDEVYSYLGYEGYVEMSCYSSGIPSPTVKITKDNNQQYGDKQSINKLGEYTIFIKTDKGETYKFGEYKCEAENNFGNDSMLISMGYAVKPVLGSVSRSLVGYTGSDTAITCPLAKGKPFPEFIWYRNGKRLSESSKYHLRTGYKEDGALVIRDTQKSDIGEYVCKGTTILGDVIGKPYLKEVTDGPDAGARMQGGTVAGIVIAVLLLIIICLDVFCCFFNNCGVTFCCYNALCGKRNQNPNMPPRMRRK